MPKVVKRDDGLYHKNMVVGKNPDGSYIRKSVYGKTQKELEAKVVELTQQVNNGIMVWENGMTFSELAEIWFDQYHPTASDKWKKWTRCMMNVHLLPTLGTMKIRDLKQIHLQAIISDRAKNGYASNTMKKIKQTGEQIMRVAIESDLITKNPFSSVKVPFVEATPRRALTEEGIALVTDNWRGARFGHGAMIMLYAGLRRGEVLALDWSDIDFEKRLIHVTKAVEVLSNQAAVKTPKTKAGYRDVPMPTLLYDVLYSVKKNSGLVCPDTHGRLMSGVAYCNAWRTFLNYMNECAGGENGARGKRRKQVIEKFSAHMLRHTYATMLFDAGVDVKSAQKFLGHADIEVTLAIYTHLTKFKEDIAITALDEHIQKRQKRDQEAAEDQQDK